MVVRFTSQIDVLVEGEFIDEVNEYFQKSESSILKSAGHTKERERAEWLIKKTPR